MSCQGSHWNEGVTHLRGLDLELVVVNIRSFDLGGSLEEPGTLSGNKLILQDGDRRTYCSHLRV